MTTLREAAQQALEALESKRFTSCGWRTDCDKAITALRAALAEPVQEPVAYCSFGEWVYLTRVVPSPDKIPLYTAPPQRKPLETKQVEQIMADCFADFADKNMPTNWWQWSLRNFARAIEQAHGIGGQP